MPSPVEQLSHNELLYFLHIPKTAGMSFTDFIKSQFAPYESISETHMSDFVKIPREQRAKCKFIAGHLYYDIDDYVQRKLVYITMLRDPVERTISHYAHIRRNPTDPGYNVVKSQSLLEFARDPRAQFLYANLQTRYIGIERNLFELEETLFKNLYQQDNLQQQLDTYLPGGYFDPTLLERAQERISRFAFVGIAERFDESLELLSHTFGWNTPSVAKAINVGTNRPHDDEISQEAIDIIRENTKLDAALYETGKQIFVESYNQMARNHSEKASLSIDLNQDTIAALQRKIDFQQKAISQLGEELRLIQTSFGWRFVLRVNEMRLKFIPHGSKIENIYLKFREHLSTDKRKTLI